MIVRGHYWGGQCFFLTANCSSWEVGIEDGVLTWSARDSSYLIKYLVVEKVGV